MQRFKLLLGTTLLVFILIVATSSKSSPEETNGAQSKETVLSKKAIEIYNTRKQKLAVELQNYFDKAISANDIVGAGVSIVHKDSIVISKGFGARSFGSDEKINSETVFRLGSLSKGFAGVLTASLESEGAVDWNDKVVDFLPKFELGDQDNTEKITLSHILSHSSGTPYHSFTNLVEAGLSMTAISERFNEVKPISEPGAQYSYQNAMFALSQEILKKATGKDIATLLQDKFFDPLRMETISMNHEALLETENVAMPHTRSKNGWRSLPLRNRYYNAIAAGGINASSLDMAKWMRFLLGYGARVLEASSIESAFEPAVRIGYNRKYYQKWNGHQQSYYGRGWRIHEFKETPNENTITVYHHGGSVNNYRNEIALFPESDLGICVLLNGNSRLARNVIPDLHQIVEDVYGLGD